MKVQEGEFLFLYNSNKLQDKEAKGYAMSIDKLKMNEKDLHQTHLTPKQVAEIAALLNLSIKDLYQEQPSSSQQQYNDEELVELLAHDPTRMITPIIISNNKSFIVESPYDLIREKLETHEIKSNYANRSES